MGRAPGQSSSAVRFAIAVAHRNVAETLSAWINAAARDKEDRKASQPRSLDAAARGGGATFDRVKRASSASMMRSIFTPRGALHQQEISRRHQSCNQSSTSRTSEKTLRARPDGQLRLTPRTRLSPSPAPR